MKRIVITIIAALLSLVDMEAQNKVYWVHGFGDNSSTWNTYKNALVDAEHRGKSINWYYSYPIATASENLNQWIDSEKGKSAIVIGHSAGGLVARNAALSNNKIRAIVTAGTPNSGAGIATSLYNKSLNNVAQTAASKVQTSAILGTEAALSIVIKGLANALSGYLSMGNILTIQIGDALANDAIENLKEEYQSPAADDMNPDLTQNSFLKNLNDSNLEIPIINLYGNEDDNRLVRIAGTYFHKEENDSNSTDECYDETAFKSYNTVLGVITGLEVAHYAAGTALGVLAIWHPSYLKSSALNFYAAASWTGTRRYAQYDVHNEWDKIIGASHIEAVEKWQRFLGIKIRKTIKYVRVYEDSDGFIPNKSSIMTGTNIQNVKVDGVNHLEMNSHPEMRRILNEILNGKGDKYDDAFKYAD